MSTNTLEIVNKFVPTSTRSKATIDLILAPAYMTATRSSFSVRSSIGSDHLPVLWTPSIKLQKNDRFFSVKRTYWTLVQLFLAYTYTFWSDWSIKSDDIMYFYTTYERFLSLLVSRLTFVSYCSAYKPSLPPHITVKPAIATV